MDKSEWSEWYKLSVVSKEKRRNREKPIPNCPGVYQIRVVSQDSSAKQIARLRKTDSRGILYIGKTSSVGVRQRMYDFFDSVNDNGDQHVAGKRFFDYGYSAIFPVDRIQFRYSKMLGDRCKRIESNLLKEYLNNYLDLPPLNFSLSKQG